MARRLIFKEGNNLSGTLLDGLRAVGYNGTVISEQYGATVSAIGGGGAINVDGVTIQGDGTLGNPLLATSTYYSNVIFVDEINGNDGTGAVNDFKKPMSSIVNALSLASSLFPTSSNKALVYVRRGYYAVDYPTTLVDYVDFYFEPGAIISYGRFSDQSAPAAVNVNFMGYADLEYVDFLFNKASTVNIEVNNVNTPAAALLVLPSSGTANITYTANKVTTDTSGTAYGITVRNSSNVTVNIRHEFRSSHSNFYVRSHSGKFVVNCPNIILGGANYYGGNWKSGIKVELGNGGTMVVNGNLVNEDANGYLGGQSGMVARLNNDSNELVTINGNIYAGDTFGVYGLGIGSNSKTIINGSVISNQLVAYVANTCVSVFKNGVLVNNNTQAAASTYPVLSMGGTGVVWVENCHMYSYGASSSLVSAFWKDTTTATLNVYNTVYSGATSSGFFIRNSAGGQPVNNVRIHNCRSTKPLDTNITDLLSPTGFTQDANIVALNFI